MNNINAVVLEKSHTGNDNGLKLPQLLKQKKIFFDKSFYSFLFVLSSKID